MTPTPRLFSIHWIRSEIIFTMEYFNINFSPHTLYHHYTTVVEKEHTNHTKKIIFLNPTWLIPYPKAPRNSLVCILDCMAHLLSIPEDVESAFLRRTIKAFTKVRMTISVLLSCTNNNFPMTKTTRFACPSTAGRQLGRKGRLRDHGGCAQVCP